MLHAADDPVAPNPPSGGSGPLSGLRVLELAGLGPAPYAAMLLADMGADVVRVDRPGPSDVIPPEKDPLRRNRSSVIVDLRRPEGAATILTMVQKADILIEGFRPGVAERLGIGPEACLEANPRLVYGRMTGWGQTGPLATAAGHDIGYLALTGALHAIGRTGQPPTPPLNLVGDFGGGSMFLAMGLLAAVYESSRSGQGQVVDAAILDGVISQTAALHGMLASGLWKDERGVNMIDSGLPWYDTYETSDGKWMAVGALEPQFYAAFVELLGLSPDEARRSDRNHWPALRSAIAGRFRSRSRDEWASVFEGTDACVSPVLSLSECADHPHNLARGSFIDVDGVRQPAPAPRFSRTATAVVLAPTLPGKHTSAALSDWGVSNVDRLLADGVVVQG